MMASCPCRGTNMTAFPKGISFGGGGLQKKDEAFYPSNMHDYNSMISCRCWFLRR